MRRWEEVNDTILHGRRKELVPTQLWCLEPITLCYCSCFIPGWEQLFESHQGPLGTNHRTQQVKLACRGKEMIPGGSEFQKLITWVLASFSVVQNEVYFKSPAQEDVQCDCLHGPTEVVAVCECSRAWRSSMVLLPSCCRSSLWSLSSSVGNCNHSKDPQVTQALHRHSQWKNLQSPELRPCLSLSHCTPAEFSLSLLTTKPCLPVDSFGLLTQKHSSLGARTRLVVSVK